MGIHELYCTCLQAGMTALHWTAESSHTSALRVLCEKGADVNAVTKVGESLLINPSIIQYISAILSAGMVFCNLAIANMSLRLIPT